MATVAYFSMEVALASAMPTYAGGLGVLAGDTLRSAADLGVPMVGITLLHRRGYFRQRLDASGRQSEEPAAWRIEDFLAEQAQRAEVQIEGRRVVVRCWKHVVHGTEGDVPVYFLDTDLPGNSEFDRTLTHHLYGGDMQYRLCQEVILGIGGVRMLRALGFDRIERFHMNEGHSSLLIVQLLEEHARAVGRTAITTDDVDAVRRMCVFTTHTPVPAGQDQFHMELARRILGPSPLFDLTDRCCAGGMLNLTFVGHNFSHYVNGVAMKHGEVERRLLADYAIDAITNGVHAETWASDEYHALFDRHIPGWRRDNFSLRYALSIPRNEVWEAHQGAKQRLLAGVEAMSGRRLDGDMFTIGYARRATAYKRSDLLLRDLDQLRGIAATAGPFQLLYAGKAHPRDDDGKARIEAVFRAGAALEGQIRLVYLEEYDLDLARLMTAGVDLWLNTPLPPLEASGTSGMKAALNGVPSLSVLDGWWIEGHVEGVTGWAIGADDGADASGDRDAADAASLYAKLAVILPLYYGRREAFIDIMRRTIALNGSFFNSHRMMEEYVLKAYAA